MDSFTARVREVAETIVVTLPRKLLENLDIEKGDDVMLQPINRSTVLLTKKGGGALDSKRLRLEVELLEKRRLSAQRSAERIEQYVANGQDELWAWASSLEKQAQIEVELASKKIEMYDLTGEADIQSALDKLDSQSYQS